MSVIDALSGNKAPADTTRFLYDGDVLCAELRHEGPRVHVHEPGSFVPLLQVERGETFTVVNDHLGMPKELVDGRGRVAWAAAHSAWGRVVEVEREPGTKEVASPFRLLGQYHDDEIGLCYTRFRYFDADAGRWCSPDPLGLVGGSNLTAFDSAPTSSIDPLGLTCGEDRPRKSFDEARREAFAKAGLTDPSRVTITKYDPITGTAVEFKGPGGAKIGYDGPHKSPGPHHDVPHISWQSAGKRGHGGAERGNIPYEGPPHPSRPDRKDD